MNRDIKSLVEKGASYYGFETDSLMTKSRVGPTVAARSKIMWYLFERKIDTLANIGFYFNGMDHSSVSAAKKRVNEQMSSYSGYKDDMDKFIEFMDSEMIYMRKNSSGVMLSAAIGDETKPTPTAFEECPKSVQFEYVDMLPEEGVKVLITILADTIVRLNNKGGK